MRITVLFFTYLLACLMLAALVSVPLMDSGWLDLEPHRVMSRLAQAIILIGIWPLLLAFHVADRASIGYGVPMRSLRRAAGWGWLLGVVILSLLLALLLALDIRVPDPTPPGWGSILSKVLQALVGGLLIALLEETFFRGALYSAVRRADGVRSAIVWSALLYAAVHFMKPSALPEGMALDASGALWTVLYALGDLFQWRNLDSLVALFMVGVFLALIRERTGHIGWCIGLHAGWVLVIQLGRKVTDGNEGAALAFLVGDYDGTIGWLAAAWIGLLALVYWLVSGRRSGSPS
ncbi:CPBP family intramembrane metalloprotease [Thiorhodococcus mannitoliphagus]|uniref:CPBP family intramembrane metalloprotease n=1 Tax=Thiorhodococcus mannitoliphagus TaxID=329406 RepID=A0A6P1DXD1_9GAMM|nr:CPBP family intramembrane glutamic endopeptidase [Thiorhodococcus mannitoliphagus]NEX22349.1 CPBP family intramembrane metalloprotease [Thiorhodococcus mannitoliphagus]